MVFQNNPPSLQLSLCIPSSLSAESVIAHRHPTRTESNQSDAVSDPPTSRTSQLISGSLSVSHSHPPQRIFAEGRSPQAGMQGRAAPCYFHKDIRTLPTLPNLPGLSHTLSTLLHPLCPLRTLCREGRASPAGPGNTGAVCPSRVPSDLPTSSTSPTLSHPLCALLTLCREGGGPPAGLRDRAAPCPF
jgi:hypothetical protein